MAGCGHSKIARVRTYYLYCIVLYVVGPADWCVDFDRNEKYRDEMHRDESTEWPVTKSSYESTQL